VPGWVVADQANLDRVARSGTTDPREGYRAWLTARWLTLAGRTIALGRFASLGERLAAFAVDLAVVTVPALLLFAAIARATPGGFDALVLGLPLNAAIVGAVSAALLYRTASEAYTGTTLGKRLLHLGVRDRSLQPPDGISALVRNVPLAPIFTLVSLGGALALAVAMKGIGPAGAIVLGVSVPGGVLTGLGIAAFVSAGTALLGSIGILVIALTWERQRVGDLWADTWVVRTVTPSPKDPEPSRVPPGPGRSG